MSDIPKEEDRTLDTFETPGPDKDDPDCLFQNRWLRRGACGAIISTSGVGKSTFSIQAATCWAAGEECLGVRPLRPLKIGIFQSEDDEYDVANFRDKIRIGLRNLAGWSEEKINRAEKNVTFCALDGSSGDRFVSYLKLKQERHLFDLIVVNPLFAFFGSDLNDGAAMTAFLRHGIDHLIKDEATKCGCLIIHHTGKPNKDAINQGDIFKAYLGSGSAEFTNYIRSALVLTPWNGGRIHGVFELIGAKHGDKLGWRDMEGRPTQKKVVCYANKLPEIREAEENRGVLYWIEPDVVQLANIRKAETDNPTVDGAVPPIEMCARRVAEAIKGAWSENGRPSNATKGQRDWVSKLPKKVTGFARSTNEAAYNLISVDPGRYGLREIKDGRSSYYVYGGAAKDGSENSQQGDLW